MALDFNKTFEDQKKKFKEKFDQEWDYDYSLYLQYLQTIYLHQTADMINTGLGTSNMYQKETQELMRSMNQLLQKKF